MIPALGQGECAQRARIDRVGRVVMVGVMVVLGVVLARVVQLQVSPPTRLRAHLFDRVSRTTQSARRGDLLDRRGRILAATRPGQRLFVDPSALKPPLGPTFSELSALTALDPEYIAQRILSRIERSGERVAMGRSPIRYVSIGGVLTDEAANRARALDIPGVHLEERAVRESLGGDAIASIIGVCGVDHDGLAGAERTFDTFVRPKPGYIDSVRDAAGRPLWVEADGYELAHPGYAVRLSLDLALQNIAMEELARGVEEANAAGGRLVLVDPATGEVLAMVDHVRADVQGVEAFTPERADEARRTNQRARFRTIAADPGRAVHPALARNRCVEDVYEPGSTFKPFMWSVVTERSLADPAEIIDTHHGVWRTDYGRVVKDVTPKDELSWSDVLVYSSNIGMAHVTRRLTDAQLHRDILRFGFGSRTNIGLPGESGGIVTPASRWTKHSQTSIAMGYEIAVTPLQMVRAFCVFAREDGLVGTLPTLRMTAEPRARDLLDTRVRVLPEDVVDDARGAMAQVAQNMLERAARRDPGASAFGYTMFGKSGTAEIVRPDGRGYLKNQHHSSFIAGAPVTRPQLVILVVIDDPGPALVAGRRHYGSAVAGPVVRRVLQRSLEYMGVPSMRSTSVSASR